jgi:hypothetical protein
MTMHNTVHGFKTIIVNVWHTVKSFLNNRWVNYSFDVITLIVLIFIMAQGMTGSRRFLALFILARLLYSVPMQTLAFFPDGKEKYGYIVEIVSLVYLFCVIVIGLVLR